MYNNLAGRFWSASVSETAAHDILHICRCGVHSFSLLVSSRTPSASLSRGVSHDALCPLSQEPDQMPKYVLAEFLADVSQPSLMNMRVSPLFFCLYFIGGEVLGDLRGVQTPPMSPTTTSLTYCGIIHSKLCPSPCTGCTGCVGSARPEIGSYFLAEIHPPPKL